MLRFICCRSDQATMLPGIRYRSTRTLAEKLVPHQRGSLPCIFLLFIVTSVVTGFIFFRSYGTVGQRNKFARLIRPCFLLSHRCQMGNMHVNMQALPILYVEWANRSITAASSLLVRHQRRGVFRRWGDGQLGYRCLVFAFDPNDQQQQHNWTDKVHHFCWALGSESLDGHNDTDALIIKTPAPSPCKPA